MTWFARSPQSPLHPIWLRRLRWDRRSLQTRLTAVVAFVALVGLGSVTVWMHWKLRQVLITSQHDKLELAADRLPRDIELYREMMSAQHGLKKAMERSDPTLVLWVRQMDGQLLAQSPTFKALLPMLPPSTSAPAALTAGSPHQVLLALPLHSLAPQLLQIQQMSLLLSAVPLRVDGLPPSLLYVAKDVSRERAMVLDMTRSLALLNGGVVVVMVTGVAWLLQRSLHPFRELEQQAQTISAENLSQARLSLDQAPSEIAEFSRAWDMMLQRLEESWMQQRQFVAHVSHELRTPLAIVNGYLQSLLRRSDNLSEPQLEALSTAASETDRTVRLLRDLLELTRADRDYTPYRLEPLALGDLVQEVAAMAERFGERTIVVEYVQDEADKPDPVTLDLSSQLPSDAMPPPDGRSPSMPPVVVKADRDRLRQVLINLVDNAAKYSTPPHPITLRLLQDNHWGIVQVCDRGIGIDFQHQTRIFEQFYRVPTLNPATPGSGLGLALVKTLVDGMHGSITVRSKPGEGTIFAVLLPLA